jgi:S-(hydroxymethyl)glutathione dehydrogenase/alcohol dehydrogenase
MDHKMKAAVLYQAGTPLEVEEVELQGPGRGEVLVRMAACGVCHSDLHILKGEWSGFDPPIVVGHEGAGVVEQVGEGVTAVQPGDHVVLGWKTSCRACRYCITGRPHLCENSPRVAEDSSISRGDQRIHRMLSSAFFAEYAVVPQSVAIPIREEMPLDRATLLGCAVMTGAGAAMNTAQVKPGTAVAVYGCGGVGVNVIQGAALCGAAQIIGVDIADDKLAYARRFGLTDAVNAVQEEPVAAILDLTGGAGVDYAFEAVGNARVMEQAFASLGKGGVAVIVGMPAFREKARLSLPLVPFYGERWVTGSYYGSANLWRDVPRLVDLYLTGKLDLDNLIARRYPLEQINQAFADLAGGVPGRGLIVF